MGTVGRGDGRTGRRGIVLAAVTLVGVWTSTAQVLPEVVREAACTATAENPTSGAFLDGTAGLDIWGAMDAMVAEIMEPDYPFVLAEDDPIRIHVGLLWQDAYTARRPPSELVDEYLAASEDPLFEDPAMRTELSEWAERLAGLQELVEGLFELPLNEDVLDLYVRMRYESAKTRMKSLGPGSNGKWRYEEVLLEDLRAFARERYRHYLSNENMTAHRAAIEARDAVEQRFQKAKLGEGWLMRFSRAVKFKTFILRMKLGLPRVYPEAVWDEWPPLRLLQAYFVYSTVEEILTDHTFPTGPRISSFENENCAVSKATHERFANAREEDVELFRRLPSTQWCSAEVAIDAVAGIPTFYTSKGLGKLVQKLSGPIRAECPAAGSIRLTGYMREDNHVLYSGSWSIDGSVRRTAHRPKTKLISLFDRAARGDADVMYEIYERYRFGEWDDADQAAVWLFRAAHAGHSLAQARVAGGYGYGGWLPYNTAAALRWATKSKDQGDPAGFWNYAVALEQHHLGSPQSLEELLKRITFWYKPPSQWVDGTKVLVEMGVYKDKAKEGCNLPRFKDDGRYAGPCEFILKEIQRIEQAARQGPSSSETECFGGQPRTGPMHDPCNHYQPTYDAWAATSHL